MGNLIFKCKNKQLNNNLMILINHIGNKVDKKGEIMLILGIQTIKY
jgi:hypothetical protein